MHIIYPIPKSPHRTGSRIGPDTWQDWYVELKKAVELHKKYIPSRIAIITDFRDAKGESEIEIYKKVLATLGVEDPLIIEEGSETIRQIERAELLAQELSAQLIFVSTPLHRLRVQYYAKKGALHITAWAGIPRLSEIPRDLAMIVLAPLLDLFGLRNFFQQKVKVRRQKGLL